MSVTQTTNLSLPVIGSGTEASTWGNITNYGLTNYLDIAIAGGLSISITNADVTLTKTSGTSGGTNITSATAQYAILNITGTKTASCNLNLPITSKWYIINNAAGTSTGTGSPFTVTVRGGPTSPTTGVTLADGEKAIVAWNGTDFAKISSSISTFTGTLPIANGGTNSTASPTAGGAAYGTGTAYGITAAGTSGNVLVSAGASAPAFGKLALGTANANVSGALTVTNGGTGATTLNGIPFGNGTSAFTTATTGQALSLIGTVPVANGGTGTTSPGLVSGTNITVTGTWPNQTISAAGGGSGSVTSVGISAPSIFTVTGSPVTTSGTLTLAYSGTALPIANGGTNSTTNPTTGGVVYGIGTAYATSAAGTAGQALVSNGLSAPSFGTLGISGGGTNSTASPTAGGIGYGTGSAHAYTAAGTSGQVLTSAGSSAPVWSNGAAQIQSISASVASSALTISASTLSLDFRSTSLTSGAVTSVTGTPANLVVPSGATLGTINGVASRLVVLAINNAGTLELAVANIATETNLTETALITTIPITNTSTFTGSITSDGILTLGSTATGNFAIGQIISGTGISAGVYIQSLISGTLGASGSTYHVNLYTVVALTTITGVAGVGIYSTTARASVACRVIGYIESTQATAGTWATAPSTIQGSGGQALSVLNSVGYGQTWQLFTITGTSPQRAVSTTYYNTTAKPIMISVFNSSTSSTGINFFVAGVQILQSAYNGSSGIASGTALVPPGASYLISIAGGGAALGGWAELR